jgi:hypothetical protein
MIIDTLNAFLAAQAVTDSAISSVIDLGATPSLSGLASEECYLVIRVHTTATADGAATVKFSLESDSTADLATAPVAHFSTTAVAKESLTAGAVVVAVKLPIEQAKRYLGVRYTVATGPLTAGKFDAYLTDTVPLRTVCADGI